MIQKNLSIDISFKECRMIAFKLTSLGMERMVRYTAEH